MGYSLKDTGRAFLILLGIKSKKVLSAKAEEIGETMEERQDKNREEIRQRIVAGRCPHGTIARIIHHAKCNYDYWERAAVAQVAEIYQLSKANALAFVSEMSETKLDKSRI